MNKEKVQGYDFKDFFGSIQLFIFYLTQKGDIEDNVTVNNIIKNPPEYLKVSDDFKNFFENEGKEIIIEKIMKLFFFIEHLCFEYSVKTLQKEYKKEIPKDLQNKITDKLLNKEKFYKLLNQGKSNEYLNNEKFNETLTIKEKIYFKIFGRNNAGT